MCVRCSELAEEEVEKEVVEDGKNAGGLGVSPVQNQVLRWQYLSDVRR